MVKSELFETLGFHWTTMFGAPPVPESTERAIWRLKRILPGYVWDASMLEGNPFTLPEVQTLIDGVTVGGHKISDELQVLNLINATKLLIDRVQVGTFRLDKTTSDEFHAVIGREEALEWGHFRGEGEIISNISVATGDGESYFPPETEPGAQYLRDLHARGIEAIEVELTSPFFQGCVYFLFGALHQFYFDANKRTARWMMNGHLMAHGFDVITIPAKRRLEFNTKMANFYRSKDASEMLEMLELCQVQDAGAGPRSEATEQTRIEPARGRSTRPRL